VPRPDRVHVPNGVSHVTQRATDHEVFFADSVDRTGFDRLLELTVKRYEWTLHAFCQLTNHVHLLIQTPKPTLSRGMQFLFGQYVAEFNTRHGRRGHLVQGRYKTVLVETQEHFLECLRYFAMNLLRRVSAIGLRTGPGAATAETAGSRHGSRSCCGASFALNCGRQARLRQTRPLGS
jgi:putative transposase